jgi:hypothetical protein
MGSEKMRTLLRDTTYINTNFGPSTSRLGSSNWSQICRKYDINSGFNAPLVTRSPFSPPSPLAAASCPGLRPALNTAAAAAGLDDHGATGTDINLVCGANSKETRTTRGQMTSGRAAVASVRLPPTFFFAFRSLWFAPTQKVRCHAGPLSAARPRLCHGVQTIAAHLCDGVGGSDWN